MPLSAQVQIKTVTSYVIKNKRKKNNDPTWDNRTWDKSTTQCTCIDRFTLYINLTSWYQIHMPNLTEYSGRRILTFCRIPNHAIKIWKFTPNSDRCVEIVVIVTLHPPTQASRLLRKQKKNVNREITFQSDKHFYLIYLRDINNNNNNLLITLTKQNK